MKEAMKNAAPVTMMFSDHVKYGKVKEYEEWLSGIQNETKKFDGFIETNIIKPADTSPMEYITLVKFDSPENLAKWNGSAVQSEWLRGKPYLVEASADMQQASGLEIWFDRPKILMSTASPPYWKQVILGVITVYPMILILNVVLKPFIGQLPNFLSLLVSVIVLSSLLTYPIMPVTTKLLRQWLYPSK